MISNHYFTKARQANNNAIHCLRRKRNWTRAKYWNRQSFHYFELHIMRELKTIIPHHQYSSIHIHE